MISLKKLSKLIFTYYMLILASIATNSQGNIVVGPLPVNPTGPLNELSVAPSPIDTIFEEKLSSKIIAADKDLMTFYEKMGRQPVWFFQGNLTKCGQIAVETLKEAALEGLNPQDYEDATTFGTHPTQWADAEILLTKRYLDYINHLRVGRIDPARISNDIKFKSPKTSAVDLLWNAVHDKASQCTKLKTLEPNIPQYIHMRELLGHYRELAKENKEWPNIKTKNTLKLDDQSPEVKILRQILILHGDLKEELGSSEKFDKDVDLALRQFQKRHTLDADGIVASKTKEALNVPIEDLIHKVIINMERLRWLPDELGDKHIIVNVAGYEVRAYENADLKLTIPAIVGRPSRRTPLFYAPLRNVIINPSWGVPYNILVHDKLPKIINDPDYVRRSGFTVTDDSGQVVDPDQADWENEGTRYHLRQSPGRSNALGRIKFNIENPYTIYLHGTPEEKLFQKTARAFSSGCIRLKTPVQLAEWALSNANKWSVEDIEKAIGQGRTQTVKPEDDISVYFTYQTVWMGDDNLIHISDDPYRMDPKMMKVLNPGE
jgi:murein L,D-transpeptidase YcbB/YkuD